MTSLLRASARMLATICMFAACAGDDAATPDPAVLEAPATLVTSGTSASFGVRALARSAATTPGVIGGAAGTTTISATCDGQTVTQSLTVAP